jgi:hypothetical protein
MSSGTVTDRNTTMWIPICCDRVMRHGVFPSTKDGDAAGILSCSVCGKHISLEPRQIDTLKDYGQGASLISVVGAPKGAARKAQASASSDQSNEETMA